jgi:NAD+ kinase
VRTREGTQLRQIGILYQSHIEQASRLAEAIEERALLLGKGVWRRSSWDENLGEQDVSETDLIVSVGGDGTLLRVTRVAAPWGIPILGVNAGRLGFLTEIEGENALSALPEVFEGRGWMEERTMLLVQKDGAPYYAMNEAVLSRGAPARVVQVSVRVGSSILTTFRGDGLIVATATGSTGYNLAAGGPVLPPEAPYMIVKPISPHPTSEAALLIDPAAHLHITVRTDHAAALSIDGQDDYGLADGDEITVRRSPYQARFLHLRPPGYFYEILQKMLAGTRRHPDLPEEESRIDGATEERDLISGELEEARQ